jgi:hypothetical protein
MDGDVFQGKGIKAIEASAHGAKCCRWSHQPLSPFKMDSSYPVYIGVWTNWSYGRVFGSTLTLKKQDGTLLIAFIAFFVTIVGAHIWKLICFFLFQLYSTNSPRDALHHQRQAILRNYSSPIGAVWVLIRMLHAWASSSAANVRPVLRILPLLLGTILAALLLAAASGLSSQITQGNEVLIDGSHCGWLRQDSFLDNPDNFNLYMPHRRRQRERAAEYAQRCYESSSPSGDCGTFVRSALPMQVKRDAPCPFDKSICRSQDSNVLIESGPIDSLTDLGLNWEAKDRFKLQHRMHCAPLVTDEYRTTFKVDNDTYTRYQYGDQSFPPSDCNCTVAVNDNLLKTRSNGTLSETFQPFQDYSIISIWAQFSKRKLLPQWSLFMPIPELQEHEGDLSLTFLFPNEVLFLEKSKDEWYRATAPFVRNYIDQEAVGGDSQLSLYGPTEPAWPMGCVEQFQVCQLDYCTGWGSRNDTVRGMYRHANWTSQFLGLGSFIDLMDHPVNLITALGKDSLASRYKAADALQSVTEANEWHLDAVHWVSTILSMLQFQIAEMSRGPEIDNQRLEKYVTRANSTEHNKYCESQVCVLALLWPKLTLQRKSTAQGTFHSACSPCSS